jgi:hypothetical protein
MTKRNLILFSALLVTLWLTWRTHEQAQTIALAGPTRELEVNVLPNKAPQPISQLVLSDREIAPSQNNLFDTPAVPVQAPSKQAVYKAPPPMAPPLPFKYLGRMQAGESSGVMLNVQGEVTPIQQGDMLLGQYQVQSITETGTSLQIQFLYLPLNQIQTLNAQITH